MKDLLRFDTVVAACALLMSTVTAGAMVYQTRVLQDQFSATVWPYLTINAEYRAKSISLRLVNEGVGPALIRSAQVLVDGNAYSGWDKPFFAAVFGPQFEKLAKDAGTKLVDSSVDASTALRAGEEQNLITVQAQPAVIASAVKHDVMLVFCYCSINGKCWTLRGSTASAEPAIPKPVGGCASAHAIAAPHRMIAPAR